MQKQDGKGRDREKRNEWFRAPRRSASSDGEARCPSAHTTSITGLASEGSANRESVVSVRGNGAGVLDAGVSASMITNRTRSLTDQQHKRRETRE